MTNPSVPSWLQKLLRYFFSYLLFALFGLLGFVLLVEIHSVIVATGTLFSDLYGLARFLNAWGFFILLGIYVMCIAGLEPYMNKAARTGEILRRGLRVFVIEGVLVLIVVLAPLITEALLVSRYAR